MSVGYATTGRRITVGGSNSIKGQVVLPDGLPALDANDTGKSQPA